ncbi:MAG: hypothetical protein WCR21_03530 [Bacteroidota bacterium]
MQVNAQSKRELKHGAEKAIQDKDWNAAVQYYNRLLRKDSANNAIKFRYAELSYLNYDLDVAFKMFLSVSASDHGEKFPLSFYYLGQLCKHKEQYKEAKAWFTRFSKLNYSGDRSVYYNNRANIEIEACDWAMTEVKKKKPLPIEHLSQSINSKSNEFAAVEKDSVLYYASAKFPDKKSDDGDEVFCKIYRAEFKGKRWQKIRALDTTINKSHFHQANTAFNDKNTVMIVSKCALINSSEYRCDFYLSKKANNKWLNPSLLDERINEPNSTNTQASFAIINNKTFLFFASNRKGGEGGMDIWYSQMTDSGTFEKPVNAGKSINTEDDEITPWFDNANQVLFFSSTYYKGLGGYDIFRSSYKNNVFSVPQNLGYPINSSYNDVYYSMNSNAAKSYLSSNRVGSYFENKINCCNDIYRFNIDTVKALPKPPTIVPPTKKDTVIAMKEQLKLLVPLTLYFNNDEPDPRTKNIVTNKNYENLYFEYSRYSQMYANEFSKGLSGEQKEAATDDILNFFNDSLDIGFDHLKRFAEMLQKVVLNNETVKITFKGYCSPLASSDYNINLAKRRISSLENYFTEYKNGWFLKYINNPNDKEGKIIFEEVDIGELSVSKASDDYKDKRNSVYSPKAAGERKIQILAIQFGN